ncbi:glycosyltransferase family 4 protein, partial [Spirosoma utsteinense]|uniref:glycosyltransferase family 4 protein n=1 Tax=Spirosoma utsteinense TaxID=2585773 RepID=UPI001645A1D0
ILLFFNGLQQIQVFLDFSRVIHPTNIRHEASDLVLVAMGTAFEPNGPAVKFCIINDIVGVSFLGKMSHANILSNLLSSSVLLHTSLEESFGMVLVEAMNYGLPIVAGKSSGAVPWVVKEAGIMINLSDIDEISDALEELLTNEDLYNKLSANGKKNVADRFSLDFVAKKYMELYEKN